MPKVHHNTDVVCFDDLSVGDWFLRENKLYLKISEREETNSYCADYGCTYHLDDDAEVKRVPDDCIEIYESLG